MLCLFTLDHLIICMESALKCLRFRLWVLGSNERRCRDNIEDALVKMQAALDAAADSTIVKEVDPATKKKLAKQYVEASRPVL